MPIETPHSICFARAAKELPQRHILTACFEIPERRLQSALGHVVSANALEQLARSSSGCSMSLPISAGNDEIAQDVPCRVDSLVAIERALAGRDFAISLQLPVGNFDQKDSSILRHAKAGLKRMQQPHPDFAQFNLRDRHARLPGQRRSRWSLRDARTRRHSNRL